MRKYRIRAVEEYSDDLVKRRSKFYPEYQFKFLWVIPMWTTFTDSDDCSLYYGTFERAKEYLDPIIKEEKERITKVKETYYNIKS